jgi:hypothetical protein
MDLTFVGRLRSFRVKDSGKLLERGIGTILLQIILGDGDLLIDGRARSRIDEEIPRVNEERNRQNEQGQLPELRKTLQRTARPRRGHGILAFQKQSLVILTELIAKYNFGVLEGKQD